MHPGSVCIELLKTWIFDTHVFGWQATGLILKICASYVVMGCLRAITQSKKAGMISGIFFAITIIGADAVSWGAAHVGLLDTIFISLSFLFGIQGIQEKRISKYILAGVCVILAFISDAARVAPMCIMGLLYIYWFTPFGTHPLLKRLTVWIIGVGIISISIFIFLNKSIFLDAAIVQYVTRYIHDPIRIVGRISLLGRFGNSLVHMAVGWFVPVYEKASTSSPTQWGIVGGWMGLIAYVYIFWRAIRIPNRTLRMSAFFLTWIVLFYLPNFLVEPRLVYGPTHRFFVLSSIGYIGLLSYWISRIPYVWWYVLSIMVYVTFNIRAVHLWLIDERQYRDKKMTEYVYGRLNEVLPYDRPSIFMITGTHLFVEFGAGYAMHAPLLFYRHVLQTHDTPLYARDIEEMYRIFCRRKRDKSPTRVSDIYAWNISSSFILEDQSENIRRMIKVRYEANQCKN